MPPSRAADILLVGALAAASCSGCARPAPSTPAPTAETADAVASAQPLEIGAPVPRIDVAHWLDRPPATAALGPGRVVVLEFVASWCPHCRAAVSDLNGLWRRYADRGVTFVAVTHESADDARSMLVPGSAAADDVPAFPVGADPDLSTHAGYLDAFGEQGVPTVFLVGQDGRLEWVGHPDILEEPLRQVVEGTWDRAAFADRLARLAPLTARVFDILDAFPADKAAAVRAYRDLVAEHAGRAAELNEIAWLLVEASTDVPVDGDPAVAECFAAAEAAVAESLRLVPDDGNTLDTLAHLQARRGDIATAVETQRRAAANPGLFAPRIRRYLGELEARIATVGGRSAPAPPAVLPGDRDDHRRPVTR